MTAVSIRLARPEDAAAVAALFRQLGYPSTADEVRERLLEHGGDTVRALVAEHEGKVAGIIVVNLIAPLHVADRWALVSALATNEAIRGAGIGAALLGEAERFAREQGCSRIELSSSESRTRAHAFYVQNGFGEVRKRFVKQM
ncbi:GNAT family N-acetyltransferase [Massilia niabensis]|uniref:GNAT family N-acetyltransferase n=1 Tax=Massilia niabensis TaxID=544910 RepID=A0ABW0L550_9BURK